MTQTVAVSGMTCQNCVRHVGAALAELPDVRDVAVDLARGEATLTVDRPVDRTALAHALEEAGYRLA